MAYVLAGQRSAATIWRCMFASQMVAILAFAALLAPAMHRALAVGCLLALSPNPGEPDAPYPKNIRLLNNRFDPGGEGIANVTLPCEK